MSVFHTQAIIDSMAHQSIQGDVAEIATFLRGYFTDGDEWTAENVPGWVDLALVNWGAVAESVQLVAA